MNTTLITAHTDSAAGPVERQTRFARAGLIAGVAAAAVTTAIAALADAAGVSLVVRQGGTGEAIPLLGFAQVTFVATLIGVGLAAILRGRSVLFTCITVALTAASLIPPVLIDAGVSTKVLLIVTHLIAAAIVIPVVAKRLAR